MNENERERINEKESDMNREEIDELLKKPLWERRAMANGLEVTVMTWHGDSREYVAGCFGRFDVAERRMGVWGTDDLFPIDPPKPEPKRVRFEIGKVLSFCTDVSPIRHDKSRFTHECNLDDCYPPGDDFCSFKEMADAGVYIRATGNGEYVVMAGVDDTWWHVETPDWNTARRRASEFTVMRQRKGE